MNNYLNSLQQEVPDRRCTTLGCCSEKIKVVKVKSSIVAAKQMVLCPTVCTGHILVLHRFLYLFLYFFLCIFLVLALLSLHQQRDASM